MEPARSFEERLRDLAGHNARGMRIVDRQGAIIFADAAAESFFQRKPGSLAGVALIGVLASGGAVEMGLHSSIGAGAVLRTSEIQWEGSPRILGSA